MENIRIDVGVDTLIDIDLTNVSFDGAKEVIFTIKNAPSVEAEPIVEEKFTEAKKYQIKIRAEKSILIAKSAEYDFQQVLNDGTRIKISDNGGIELRHSVGDKID